MLVILEQNISFSSRCATNGFWLPVGLPFFGTYDDYGTFRDCYGVFLPQILEAVKENAIEVDTSRLTLTHDNFDVDKLFEAIREDSLRRNKGNCDKSLDETSNDRPLLDLAVIRMDVLEPILEADIQFAQAMSNVPIFIRALCKRIAVKGMDVTAILLSRNVLQIDREVDKFLGSSLFYYSDIIDPYACLVDLAMDESLDAVNGTQEFLRLNYLSQWLWQIRRNWAPGGCQIQSEDLNGFHIWIKSVMKVITKLDNENER